MAPSILGQHRQATCSDCGYSFRFTDRSDVSVVCPNCGFVMEPGTGELQTPTSVRIDRSRPPQRFDAVAFRLPDQPGEFGIKRVVGLPGEAVQLKHGNLWIDGKPFRKPIELQRQMRIPVHDSAFQSPSSDPGRWRPEYTDSGWNLEGRSLVFAPSPVQPEHSHDWLIYQHWRCCEQADDRQKNFPIEDLYAFNQGLNRNLNPTNDLFLEIELRLQPASSPIFAWSFESDPVQFLFELDFGNRSLHMISKETDGPGEALVEIPDRLLLDSCLIEFSTFDDQILVTINGVSILEQETDLSGCSAIIHPLRIGARMDDHRTGKISVDRIRVFRDIYYSSADPNRSAWESGNGYFLLGDNVPVSIDSRRWSRPHLPPEAVIGVVVEGGAADGRPNESP